MDMKPLKSRRREVAALLKTLGHPDRLAMVCCLADRSHTVSELVESCGISQSYASQGLKRMEKEGLLASRREGGFSHYSVADPRLKKLLKHLKGSFCPE